MNEHIPRSVSSAIGRSWVREERKRIRAGLSEAFKEVKSLTPGMGGPEDEWIDAARNMYRAALKIVRR